MLTRRMRHPSAGLSQLALFSIAYCLCAVSRGSIGSSSNSATASWVLFVSAADTIDSSNNNNNNNNNDETNLIHDDNSLLSASEILLKLYDETRGLRWETNTNWLQVTDACTWYGITCYDTTTSDQRRVGHVQKIDLSANRLMGTVPQEVFQLPYLESLDVRDNVDVSMTFDNIGDAQYLKEISFSNTNVKSLQGMEVAKQLETLHITSLGLTGEIPSEIFQLTNLLGLFANYNKFTGSLSSQLGQLTYLSELYLFDSDLTGQIPTEIGLLSNLQVLTLAENGFEGTLPTELSKCTKLTTLAINRALGLEKGAGISGPLPSLSQLGDMKDLRLQNQRLSGSIPSDFLSAAPREEVVKVELSGNAITGTVPTSLKNLKRLNMFLADNRISSVPDDLCNDADIGGWLGGNVQTLGCDGFLCRPGTTASQGRATPDESCVSCDGVQYWGSTRCSSSPTTTAMGYTEREVLINLYNKMGGRYWKYDDGWMNPAQDICDWYGVECVGGKVTGLLLKDNDLSNSPPMELFSLPELKHLDFESNSIGFQFKGIGKARKLETLILTNCDLNSLEDIGELKSTAIRKLSLASNDLEGSIPTELFDLVGLEELDISHSKFTGVLPTQVGSLTNLQNLIISKNKLVGQLPSNLGFLTALRVLVANDNGFEGTLPAELNSLTRLEVISLHQATSPNGIGGPLLAFQNLGQLTSLQLDSNNLSGALPDSFLRNTEKGDETIEVRLSDNRLEGKLPSSWASRFRDLLIDLSGNKISGIDGDVCKKDWNNGNVNAFSCDGLLCPPGKFNEFGRQTSSDSGCRDCSNKDTVQFYGSKTCNDAANIAIQETSELGILKEFFDSTNGNNWKNSAGWMSSNNPCDGWFGLECNADGRIVTIDLESNALVGSPSTAIFQLSSLRSLSLKDNDIVFSFEGISQASNLAVLTLSGTGLDSVAGISKASGLTELHLTDNNLKGAIDSEIFQLTNLRKLYLNYNSLSGKITPSISALKNLEELFLYNNRLTGQIPASIGLLTRLKHLSLAENAFSGTLPPEINDLTNLEILSIQREGGTEDSTVGIDQGDNDDAGRGIGGPLLALENLKYLKKLYMGYNSFGGTIPPNFLDGIDNKALPIEIDLISNRLTGTLPPSLTQFSDFSLFVAGNEISGIADGLCQKDGWMDGSVAKYKCDAILCPPGTFSSSGRQKDGMTECAPCDTVSSAPYYGSFRCMGDETKQVLSERTILEDLYRATGGVTWKQNAMWLDSDESLCSWFGITCVSDKESVASIRLQGNGLKGEVPPELYQLPNLKEVDLSNNPVDMNFIGIAKASNLEYLQLDTTNIQSLSGLDQATNLNFLHVANNNLASNQFPSEIASLTRLASLDLSGNPLGTLPSLANQSNLKYFACSQCGISGSFPAWVSSLTKLEHIELNSNSFTGAMPSLSGLSELKYLNLADQISYGGSGLGGSLPVFAGMTQLQQVYLQRNGIGSSIPDSFLSDISIEGTVTVDLTWNNISGTIPQGLTRFTNLKLYLASNRIDSIPDSVCVASWNDKDVSSSGCDHILCAKGSFNAIGRATPSLPCNPCPDTDYATYFGSTECGPAFEKNLVYGLFENLGGPTWTHSDGWQDHDDFCSWYGVTCYQGGFRDGFVQKIDLRENNLKGTLNVPIWQLVHMKELDLSQNNVVVAFEGIENAQSLDTLHLSETNISTIQGVGSAPALKYLHLTNCRLAGTIPDELFEMTQLKGLYLNYNSLTGPLPEAIGQLSQLEEIYLFHNALSGTIPTEIGLLEQVEIISFGENKFSGVLPIELNSLQELRVLALQAEETPQDMSQFFMVVQDVGLTGSLLSFSATPKLRELYLSNNHFGDGIPNDFLLGIKDTSSTIIVDLSSNILTGVPASLVRFDDLRLDLTGNNVRDIPNELCAKTEWFGGELAAGCDALLCPPGTYNEYGRRIGAETCESCNFRGAALFYGSRMCGAIYPQGMTDSYMLQEIYASTSGLSWDNSENWLREDVSLCEWYGITCVQVNGQDHVSELDLSDNGLEGLVPSIVFYLPHLKKLNLGKNKVWVKFDDIQYSVLEELFLDKTNVASLDGISKAASLRTLHLPDCPLNGETIPEEFYNLVNLTVVDLSQCGLSGTLSAKIGNLQNLASLLIDRNDLSGQIPSTIGQLKNLQDLVLSENNFFGTLPPELNRLTSLTSLYLNAYDRKGAGISGPLLSFSSLPKLRELHLGSNSLTSTIPSDLLSGIVDFSYVVNVDFSGNHLTGSVPSELTAFQNLNLYVSDNYITSIGDGLCKKSSWLEGAVGTYSCNGLLCPPGTYNDDGRQSSEDTPCIQCGGDSVPPYMGQTSCLTDEKKKEREILELLYRATGGDNWKNSAGWLQNNDYCNWYGISCSGGIVESISLGSNNLAGSPPEEIFELKGLKVLWLYSNPIDFKFDGIDGASNLEHLRLDSTGLKSLDGIEEAQSLIEVDVRFNRLKGELPNLDKLVLLESFSCSANMLSGSLPSFTENKKLVSLRAGGNFFSGLLPSFSTHAAIRTLDVSSNELSGGIPQNLFAAADTSASIFLDFSSNNFVGELPSNLSRFSDLTVYLRDNRIDSMPPSLCSMKDWNQGDVGLGGCDGILCPPNTYSPVTGRESRGGSKCERCDSAQFFGSTTCGAGSGAGAQARVVRFVVVATLVSSIWLLL